MFHVTGNTGLVVTYLTVAREVTVGS